MHTYFGEWYREAKLEFTGEMLEKRWKAIEKFARQRKDIKAKALDLIRVFYDLSPIDPSFTETFSEVFVRADPSFPMRNNTFELRVLAGAATIHLIERSQPEFSDMLSLAVACGECEGLRDKLPFRDVLEKALDSLYQRSISLRIPTDCPGISMPELNLETTLQEMTNAFTTNNLQALNNPTRSGLEQIASSISGLYETTLKTISWLNQSLQLQQEEMNILWWLFSQSSRDLKVPFSELDPYFACVMAGKELADLVIVMPGPLAVEAFLRRMLSGVENDPSVMVSLQAVVNRVPREWRRDLVPGDEFKGNEDLLPVHFAITKSLETDGEADWVPAFRKTGKLRPDGKISLDRLSFQVYRERLLARSLVSN
ncbi:MAG: hypothetical protein KAW49_14105 [Anaerolineae bacterium]|nr:hypothetical protein [Anaerolineae bacterium]